ncbi:MAG: Rrf2 family transcriptional regulator [Phycisphaerales bacterium]|nr:Rrf2 family transcriptional regulator [Phycisphaerales bacterium]MCB9854876.1 Rrf2 family transcriptional regulator [Phycisphaerales bacterium]MCB9865002.1 Rrf2 family transcriptional regulator [Phycisphaerales bacterium]
MISLTSEYALKALVYLTQQPGYGPVTAHVIAAELDIPGKYLSRILRDLVTARVLSASPGRTGGFRLACDPKTLRLADVLAPFERVLGARAGCPFSNKSCDDECPCAGHQQWSALRARLQAYLRETSIYDVAFSSKQPSRPARKPRKRRTK